MSRIAVFNCSQLVTLAGPGRPRIGPEMREVFAIDDGGLLIEHGRIIEVDHGSAIRKRIQADTEIVDAEGGCVLPGFVDAHAHPIFAGDRLDEFEMRSAGATYEEIAATGGGILSTVAKTRAADEDDLADASRDHLEWALRSGTTTVEVKSGYGLNLKDEIKMLRVAKELGEAGPMRLVPTLLIHAIPPDADRKAYILFVLAELLPAIIETGLAEYCDIFCEQGYFTIEDSREILNRAKELGLGIRIHADQLSNNGGARLAAELGAKTADHLEQTDRDGILAMKAAGVQPVVLPGSVFALGKARYADARTMIDEGLALVLASDFNPGSSPTASIPMVMNLACTQMRLTPAEALTACTINAAHSLDRGGLIGSLEPGKRADFTIWAARDYREIAYWFGDQRPEAIYIGGTRV